jgi:hypothetical protein
MRLARRHPNNTVPRGRAPSPWTVILHSHGSEFLRLIATTTRLAVMFPFWMDFTASSLSTLLATLAGTVTVLMTMFATPR